MIITRRGGLKWWGLIAVLMLTFSAVDVWAFGAPLPTAALDETAVHKSSIAQKINSKIQKAQAIYQKTVDLAQRGYGAACSAYAAAKSTVQGAIDAANELKEEAMSQVKNLKELGKCGVDMEKKILSQKKEDKKKCKEEFKDDADGYKKCIEDAKTNRKTMKKSMLAECKKQANQAVADTKAKAKEKAQEVGKTTAQGIKDISYAWGKKGKNE